MGRQAFGQAGGGPRKKARLKKRDRQKSKEKDRKKDIRSPFGKNPGKSQCPNMAHVRRGGMRGTDGESCGII